MYKHRYTIYIPTAITTTKYSLFSNTVQTIIPYLLVSKLVSTVIRGYQNGIQTLILKAGIFILQNPSSVNHHGVIN